MIKYLITEAVETYRQEGLTAIWEKAHKLCERNINHIIFKKNKIIHGTTVYEANSVKFDIDFSQFNKQTRSNLMSEEHFSHVPKIGNIIAEYSDGCDFVEVGGGSGYTSCYFNRCVGENKSHITIEANPLMIEVLLDTRSKNNCDFQVLSAAYSPENGLTELKINESYAKSATVRGINSSNKITCGSVSIKRALSKCEIDEFVLFCNAEGIEYDLIESESDILKNKCSLLIVSFHDLEQTNTDKYIQNLKNNNFRVVGRVNNFYIFNNIRD